MTTRKPGQKPETDHGMHSPSPIDILTAPFFMDFDNAMTRHEVLEPPTEAALMSEPTYRAVEFNDVLRSCGDYTRYVLGRMEAHLKGNRRFTYVDSKIQYLRIGDAPVDSLYWHIDGCVYVPEKIVRRFGYVQLFDLYARSISSSNPTFLSFLTSADCATEYVRDPMRIEVPKCFEWYDVLDALVKAREPRTVSQTPCQVVSFGSKSLHRAVPAKKEGWRLWIRITETDCRQRTHEGVDNNTVFSTIH